VFPDDHRIVSNDSRGSYPGYVMIPTDGCQIPQAEIPPTGRTARLLRQSRGHGCRTRGSCLEALRLGGSSAQCSQTPHCGNTLTRAGDVLALVSQLPSATLGQSHGSRDLVSPLEPTHPIPVGHTGARVGSRSPTATRSHSSWPSLGNFHRTSMAISPLLGCPRVTILHRKID
jgi:hypothetical protein